ncbi:hypothetical protein H4Q32_021358 [Labeo rohita]|uniref:Uncharacterized protein n=1 Tax=Labeo rohita TaxID=84645 RepID=A0ABQ8MQP2_LABRO|nr:hypothetical protein H4Q32_021358 [Labeo rohita]
MAFTNEESENMKIEETFRVKHEDTEEQTRIAFIKEDSEDLGIETFRGTNSPDAAERGK